MVERYCGPSEMSFDVEPCYGGVMGADRGKESERQTRELIATLPYVNQVIDLSGSYQDRHCCRDIGVRLSGPEFRKRFKIDLAVPLSLVWIQVKSSSDGIRCFKSYLRRKLKLTPDELEEQMQLDRLVVLNGSKEEGEIFKSFEGQLREINNYWISQPKVRQVKGGLPSGVQVSAD